MGLNKPMGHVHGYLMVMQSWVSVIHCHVPEGHAKQWLLNVSIS
jgi:hypothetical protein